MTTPPKSRKAKTVAIHSGQTVATKSIPISPPIHVSAVSYFEDSDTLDRALDGSDFSYSRIEAQNTTLLEQAIAAVEGAEACVSYASGMAALKAVVEAQRLGRGDRVVMPADGYGVTRLLFRTLSGTLGFEVHPVALSAKEASARIRELRPKLVLAESVTNPLLSVPDLRALAKACRDAGAVFAVDATFPSPALQRACELGADYAIQSTTKWLNGHSDALGGTVAGSAERISALKQLRIVDGAVLGPFEAWLTLRGVRTLPVRMKAHSEHALHIARRLQGSPLLDRVIYPGLPDHPDHAVAREVLTGGFGGMIAFEIKGGTRQTGFKLLEAVQLARPAPSLGDVGTLVMHAASASARRMTQAERDAAGIRESLIRVSVGLEDPDDIADDLLQAVARAQGK